MFKLFQSKVSKMHQEAMLEDAKYNNKQLQNTVKHLVNQTHTLQARDLFSRGIGGDEGKRDIYDIYNYPVRLDYDDVYQVVRRDAIARRIAYGIPSSCWGDGVCLEVGDEKVLEDELSKLAEKGMFDALRRAHVMARMGNYSAVFVGIGGQDFSQPLTTAMGNAIESLYFRAYSYSGIQPADYEGDVTSPRYGKPTLYQLQVISQGDDYKSQETEAIFVHWTRVVTLSEGNLDNDLEGLPTLEAAFNLLIDIQKATGGSAEAYFRNARDKTVFEINPEFASGLMNDPNAKDSFDEAAQSFTNDWQDHIMAAGSKVYNLQTSHHSPKDTVLVAIWQISSLTGIPIKMLIGEGAGQLSGLEDKLSYNEMIQDVQNNNCTKWLNGVLEILNIAGIIQLPDEYEVDWPIDSALNEKDEADINLTKSQTIKTLADAKSTIGGDGLDLKSAMDELELGDIDFDEPDPITGFDEPATMPEEDDL